MPRRTFAVPLALMIGIAIAPAHAASVTLWTSFYESEPFPEPRKGLQLFLSSDADIVSISHVRVDSVAPLVQIAPPFASNVEPPNPIFVAINSALAFDSWLSTPGATTLTGADLPGDGTGVWSDETDEGPQTNFQWGMLTPPLDNGFIFTGRINMAGPTGLVSRPFRIDGLTGEVTIPEPPAIAIFGLTTLGVVINCRKTQCVIEI